MSALSDEQIAKIAYYSAGGFGDQVIERIEAAIREALVLQAKSHAAVAEVVEINVLAKDAKSRIRTATKMYHNANEDWTKTVNEDAPVEQRISYWEWIDEGIDKLHTALTHATLAKEAADASVGRLMDETQRMAKLYDAMEDRAEAAEKEAGRLQTDAQILHEIAIALESRGYIHMCNGGSISSLLDEMLVVEKQLSAFYSEGGLNRLTQCQDALSRAEQRAAAMEANDAIGRAVNRAAKELPDDCEIRIEVERGSGSVSLILPNESVRADFDDADSFASQINKAIDAAIAAQSAGGGG